MNTTTLIEVKQKVLDKNDHIAEELRRRLSTCHCTLIDVLGSPGAGKTTLLAALIGELTAYGLRIGVIEADLESNVDEKTIAQTGARACEINTHGACHVDARMISQAVESLEPATLDLIFLENIGNLVCPADFDTGAHARVLLLSVPEGYDKVYKYPYIFAQSDVLAITKADYLALNPDFDVAELKRQAHVLQPDMAIFETSARNYDGIEALGQWIRELTIRNQLS